MEAIRQDPRRTLDANPLTLSLPVVVNALNRADIIVLISATQLAAPETESSYPYHPCCVVTRVVDESSRGYETLQRVHGIRDIASEQRRMVARSVHRSRRRSPAAPTPNAAPARTRLNALMVSIMRGYSESET